MLLFERADEMLTALISEEKKELYTYNFPKNIFADFKTVLFEQSEVLILSKSEEFLRIGYGDWQTSKSNTHYIYSYENLTVGAYQPAVFLVSISEKGKMEAK
jgi:hypothetical protein